MNEPVLGFRLGLALLGNGMGDGVVELAESLNLGGLGFRQHSQEVDGLIFVKAACGPPPGGEGGGFVLHPEIFEQISWPEPARSKAIQTVSPFQCRPARSCRASPRRNNAEG